MISTSMVILVFEYFKRCISVYTVKTSGDLA